MFRHAAVLAASFVICAHANADARVKIRDITSVGTGLPLIPHADGSAHLFYDSVEIETEVRFTITHFEPCTFYDVAIVDANGFLTQLESVLTNPRGNGTYRFDVLGIDLTVNDPLIVFSKLGEVHAVGYSDLALAPRANTVKIRDFDPAGPGVGLNPCGDGSAHLTYDSYTLTTEVRVTITHFEPNSTYQVAIVHTPPGSEPVQEVFNQPHEVISTNSHGSGSVLFWAFDNQIDPERGELSVIIFQTPLYTLDPCDCDDGDFTIVSECEVRAIGTPHTCP